MAREQVRKEQEASHSAQSPECHNFQFVIHPRPRKDNASMLFFFRRLIVLAVSLSAAFNALAAPRAEHVFIISIDGGKPAVIAQSRMPVLQKLVADGAHTWAASTIFPSKTLPAHTSMLTGVGPQKHHILWNDYLPTNGVVRVPTVFSLSKQSGFSTAMFVGKKKFRHLLLPDSVDEFDFNQAKAGYVVKMVAGEKKVMEEGTVLAKIVAQDAARYIVKQKPNLCFIHFTDPDDVGHKYGWGSPEQIGAFADTDAALGVVLDAIKEAGITGQSVIIITADHGGHAKTHGLAIPDDMIIPWIAWGRGVKHGFEITAPVKTYDTAATALWLLGISCPESLDGQPVASAFE
jgi:predicted AlkP superfamily pyrophosphatase or phosphodiesterase